MSPAQKKSKPEYGGKESVEIMKMLFNRDCHRCGGLMITEQCFDVESNTGEFEIEIRKCLSCGETIDPTILKNRRRNEQPSEGHSLSGVPANSLPLLIPGY